ERCGRRYRATTARPGTPSARPASPSPATRLATSPHWPSTRTRSSCPARESTSMSCSWGRTRSSAPARRATSGSPSVPFSRRRTGNAYAVVLDRRPALGTATGKVYAATNVGVYVTVDEGATWVRIGNSLPTAPVVDLQLDPNSNILGAATQGRGLFVVSVAAIS